MNEQPIFASTPRLIRELQKRLNDGEYRSFMYLMDMLAFDIEVEQQENERKQA